MAVLSFAEQAKDSKAVIFGLSGKTLTPDEKAFFKGANPFGFILFARNCETPAQVRGLTDDLRETVGRECPILIDQEGGRVQRLKPPQWRAFPPARQFGEKAEENLEQALENLRFNTLQMADELREIGVNVNCTPVMDVLFPETHEIIGDRAFGTDPALIGRLGVSVCRHYLAAGITPVIKHIPGHGRACSDSHLELPVVDTPLTELQETDFVPFQIAAQSDVGDAVWAMSAHVVYSAIDPDHPASTSSKIIHDIIRKEIGFNGLLVSDDLDMKALDAYGDAGDKARAVLDAGCDIALHCSGNLKDMQKIAKNCPQIGSESLKRLQKAAQSSNMAA